MSIFMLVLLFEFSHKMANTIKNNLFIFAYFNQYQFIVIHFEQSEEVTYFTMVFV